jgi:hypothetical protein
MQPVKSGVNSRDKRVMACQFVSHKMVNVLFDKDTWWRFGSEKLSAVHPMPRFSCRRMGSDCVACGKGYVAGSRVAWDAKETCDQPFERNGETSAISPE